MITNEVTDLLFLPVANLLSGNLWDVFLQTKLYLVPFILVLGMCVAEAMGAGADEGSPAIQAYRKFEVRSIGMFFVILFAAQPFSFTEKQSYADIKYTSYSCLPYGLGAGFSLDQMQNNPTVRSIEKSTPTLWHGLTNMFATGITNAAISAIPCDVQNGNSVRKALTSVATALPSSNELDYMIKEYHNQCYLPAITRIADIAQNTDAFDEAFKDKTFYGTGVKQVLDGTSHQDHKSTLTAKLTTKKYSGTNFWGSLKAVELTCDELGEDIFQALSDEVTNGTLADDFAIVGSLYDYSEGKKLTMNINRLYDNAVAVHEAIKEIADNGFRSTKGSFSEELISSVKNTLGYAVNAFNMGTESIKIIQYQATAPIVISIVKLVLVIAMPIMLMLVGYKVSFLLVCSTGYVAIELSKFWFELGVYLDEAVNGLLFNMTILSYPDGMNPRQAEFLMSTIGLIGQMVNYSLPTAWFIFVGWMGVKLVGAMGMSDEAGRQAKSGASAIGALALASLTKGGSKILFGGGKGKGTK